MATNVVYLPVNESLQNLIHVYDRNVFAGVTVVIALAANITVTVLCFCLASACLVFVLHRYLRQREERDKLCKVIANQYWISEEQITLVVHLLTSLQKVVLFRDVTAFHVLGYKYRCENGVYGNRDARGAEKRLLHPYLAAVDVFQILKKIERLFDSLMLQLTCRGKCPQHIANAFSATLYGLVQVTSLIWCDHKVRGIRRLVEYFAGRASAEVFDGLLISDADLETLIVSRVPYVGQLYLNGDHFVLKDCEISGDGRIDLKSKIRYVDTVLAKEAKVLQAKEKNIVESYYAARELCLKNGFIQTKSHFPDVSKFPESDRATECVGNLRHLLRLMCGVAPNVRKIENDDKFFQFLMQLHEALYSWMDEQTMIEVIERCRNNIVSILHSLTIEQILADREFTKAKLEQLEKELYRHLNYLTIRQVQYERRQHHDRLKEAGDARMRPADSESSVYTMALSTSSYALRRQMSQEHSGAEASLLVHQQSIDQGSIASGSSIYATATLLSSFSETLLPGSRASPVSHKMLSRPASDSDGEFFETPV